MKTARWFVTLFLAVSLIFTFCACDEDDKKEKEEEETTADYSVEITKCKLLKDYGDYNRVDVTVVYTNNGSEPASFYGDYNLNIRVYQDGVELNQDWMDWEDSTSKIKMGSSITLVWCFDLRNTTSDLEVEIVTESFGNDGKLITKIVEKQVFKIADCIETQ